MVSNGIRTENQDFLLIDCALKGEYADAILRWNRRLATELRKNDKLEKKLIVTQAKAIGYAGAAFGDAAGVDRWWSKILRIDPIIVHIIDSVNDRVNKEILEEFPDCPLLEF